MTVLDWRHTGDWASKPEPCVICRKPTRLRSPNGKPCHKVCAETWTDQHTRT